MRGQAKEEKQKGPTRRYCTIGTKIWFASQIERGVGENHHAMRTQGYWSWLVLFSTRQRLALMYGRWIGGEAEAEAGAYIVVG